MVESNVAETDIEPGKAASGSIEARLGANGCFVAGTLIGTEAGTIDVAQLRAGDRIMTLAGPRVLIRVTPRMSARSPVVRVRSGALTSDVPVQEVVLAADQQVVIQDLVLTTPVLVGFGVLVNAGSIQREFMLAQTEWFALEFDRPELVLVSGMALSSHRQPGQSASLRVLPPGPALFALRARLTARVATVLAETAAEMLLHLPASDPHANAAASLVLPARDTAEPGWVETLPETAPTLRLIGDGEALEASSADGLRWRFALPAGSRWLRLASPSRMAEGDDARKIGVAVLHMALDGVPLTLTGLASGAGFYPAEGPAGGQWRWTDGFAQVLLPVSRRTRALEVVISNWHEASTPSHS